MTDVNTLAKRHLRCSVLDICDVVYFHIEFGIVIKSARGEIFHCISSCTRGKKMAEKLSKGVRDIEHRKKNLHADADQSPTFMVHPVGVQRWVDRVAVLRKRKTTTTKTCAKMHQRIRISKEYEPISFN